MEIYKSNVRDVSMSVANDLIEQVIKRMIQYQFGVKDDYGWFDITDTPTVEDMNILADVIQKLTGAGVVSPTEEFIRDKFKFPEADADFLAVNNDVEQ